METQSCFQKHNLNVKNTKVHPGLGPELMGLTVSRTEAESQEPGPWLRSDTAGREVSKNFSSLASVSCLFKVNVNHLLLMEACGFI